MGESKYTYPPKSKILHILSPHRHVGNSMAGLVMQSLGCEVAALNTVHFSKGFKLQGIGCYTHCPWLHYSYLGLDRQSHGLQTVQRDPDNSRRDPRDL